MDNPNDHILTVCTKHNQPIAFYEKANNNPLCLFCLQEKAGMIPAEKYQQKFEEIIKKDQKNQLANKQLYQNLFESILNFKNTLIQSLDKLLQIIRDQITMINSHQQKIQQYVGNKIQQKTIEDLEKQIQEQELYNQQFKNQVKELLIQLQKKYLTYEQLMPNTDTKQKIVIKEQIVDWNKIEFETIYESSRSTYSSVFAFNKESTLLVAGFGFDIIVQQFKNGVIGQELQRLTGHNGDILCLYFMKKSNSFVSGGYDCQIIIWELNNNNKWFEKSILIEDYFDRVYCIIMNANENSLISVNGNKTIIFWKKFNDNWSVQQNITTRGQVNQISLNERENQLILSGEHISVMEIQNDDQWRIVQFINVNIAGTRLCFTSGNEFVFQPGSGDQLEVYSSNNEKKLFEIFQKVQIKSSVDGQLTFPCQYVKQLKMITIKHGNYLNIYKINQAGDYKLISSIMFNYYFFSGRLTDDGQYLLIQEYESKQIQVRKLWFLQ